MTSRDPFFDNAKLLLVMLVVVGHSWVLMPDAPYAQHRLALHRNHPERF